MTQQEQERQAIEEAAYNESIIFYGVGNDKQNERGCIYNGFIAGAEFVLSELRKPLSQTESFFEWAQRNGYAMRSDGKWSRDSAIETDESLMMMYNSELRRPSEENIIKFQEIIKKRDANIQKGLEYGAKHVHDLIGGQNKPSEKSTVRTFGGANDDSFWVDKPYGKQIQKILKIMDENKGQTNSVVAFELAKLFVPNQGNDVNAKLLEAAKYFRDAWNCEWSKLTARKDDVDKHNSAISNAEKRIKS